MSVVYHKLTDGNLVQNWSQSSLISSSNDWSGVPSIQGFSNVEFGSGIGADARAFTGESETLDVAADVLNAPSRFNPNSASHGGVAEFQDFGMVALGAGTHASVPNLVVYLDTTGVSEPVSLNFDVQDLDGSSRDSDQQVNVQYRIGETGQWINVPGGYLADVTDANATPTTHVSVTLPLDALGQSQVQLRIMTSNAEGRDEWIGIDNIVVACFLRGTLIRTDRGEVPVETLTIGDRVATADRGLVPVKWIGRRSFGARFLKAGSPVVPVLIRADALADNVPSRDLRVSPEHALHIDGVLVPAVHLVNGRTITRDAGVETVDYFHIELEGQAIVFADGAPAETYVNHDNRRMFANWRDYVALYGEDASRVDADGAFERVYPCVVSGPQLAAIRAVIDRRAAAIAHAA